MSARSGNAIGQKGKTMRIIDADALAWLVEEYKLAITPITEDQEHDNRLPLQMLTEFENIIDKQPTVDAVPVVMCRDCKHHEVFKNGVNGWCNKHECQTDVTYFCADGERRTE